MGLWGTNDLFGLRARRDRLSSLSLVEAAASRRARDGRAHLPRFGEDLIEGRFCVARARAQLTLMSAGVSDTELKAIAGSSGLDASDAAAGLAIGLLGAILPSLDLSFGSGGPGRSLSVRDLLHRGQDRQVKHAVEALLGTDSASQLMDHAKGSLHRFLLDDHSHDPVTILASLLAGALGIPQLTLEPALKILAHLLVDAAGATGIPIPTSTYLRGFLSELLGDDPLSPRGHSRYLSYRHSDLFAAGSTSLLLWLYGKARGVEAGSARSHKIAIVAHGVASVALLGIASAASAAGSPSALRLVARRSQVNYASVVMLTKNVAQLTRVSKSQRTTAEAIETAADARAKNVASRPGLVLCPVPVVATLAGEPGPLN